MIGFKVKLQNRSPEGKSMFRFYFFLLTLLCSQVSYGADDADRELRRLMQAHREQIEQIRYETAREISDSVTRTREVLLDDQRRGIQSLHDRLTALETHLKANEEHLTRISRLLEEKIEEDKQLRLRTMSKEVDLIHTLVTMMERHERRMRELTEAALQGRTVPPATDTELTSGSADSESTSSDDTNG
jgi:hypothetical protein